MNEHTSGYSNIIIAQCSVQSGYLLKPVLLFEAYMIGYKLSTYCYFSLDDLLSELWYFILFFKQ